MASHWWWQLAAAWGVDALVGDPAPGHPVIAIGRATAWIEKRLCPGCAGRDSPAAARPGWERGAGVALVFMVVGGAWLGGHLILGLCDRLGPIAGHGARIWLLAMCLAGRSLAVAARAVSAPLEAGDLVAARRALAQIVGRDTECLPPSEVIRAAVETVAENTSDGFVAPLFWAALGGVPMALAYKAINTLDSMVGYRDHRYRWFGWAAARLDDLANLVPARLTALLLVAAAGLSGQGVDVVRRGLVTVWQDARLHPSPNAGWPEAAVAGLLGVRLGGENRYRGRRSCRPFLGRAYVELTPAHIRRTVALMQRACTLATAGAVLVRWWCRA